jgi:hypothetical protein
MRRVSTILATVLLFLAPVASWADLAPYSQDFEGLNQPDPGALAADGWSVFGNVFSPDGTVYYYGYGPYPAPNGGPAFSGIDVGQGGPAQGAQQLVVYNDYNNWDHNNGFLIEANVYQQQDIGAADVGNTWLFEFDAKRGNIQPNTTALAFIKTLDPNAGWALTNFITVDMTNVPETWGSYTLSIFIDPGLVGQVLQIGFLNTTTYYTPSGIFYDNINFDLAPLNVNIDIKPGSFPNSINPFGRGLIPVAILGSEVFDVSAIDVTTLRFGPAQVATRHDLTDDWDYNEHLADVNFDGFMDLVTHFTTQDTGIACGDIEAVLSGALLDGTPFEGADAVRTVGCNSNRPSPGSKNQKSSRRRVDRPRVPTDAAQ